VATALLVADPTLTLWIPGKSLFASTSSYSSLVQYKVCQYNDSFQSMHSSSQDTQKLTVCTQDGYTSPFTKYRSIARINNVQSTNVRIDQWIHSQVLSNQCCFSSAQDSLDTVRRTGRRPARICHMMHASDVYPRPYYFHNLFFF